MGKRELIIQYEGALDRDLEDVLRAALKTFGYELTDGGYGPETPGRDLHFLKE